jgi:formiminotetrahydrofolate cyclodeaminase
MNETTLTQFLDAVGNGSPTPGGGSAAALTASLAAALVEMVVNLTVGKPAFGEYEGRLKEMGEEAHSYREALAQGIRQDIEAYQSVLEAYLLPKGNEEEKRKRKEQIQKALKKAADPPLFTAATSLKVLKLCEEAVKKGNPSTLSDAGVGTLLAYSGLKGGILNVLVNLLALDDRHLVEKLKKDLQRLETEGEKIKHRIMDIVQAKISCP